MGVSEFFVWFCFYNTILQVEYNGLVENSGLCSSIPPSACYSVGKLAATIPRSAAVAFAAIGPVVVVGAEVEASGG